jgi:hypothetical protein
MCEATHDTPRSERLDRCLDRIEARLQSIEAKLGALPGVIAELIAASEKRLMAAIAERQLATTPNLEPG